MSDEEGRPTPPEPAAEDRDGSEEAGARRVPPARADATTQGSSTEGDSGAAAAGETTTEVDSGGGAEEEPARFDLDPRLAAMMAEAEASYDRRKHGDPGDEGVEVEVEIGGDGPPPAAAPPTLGGAGEGVVRALAEMRKARDELEVAEQKVKDLEDRLMRSAADLDNYKKRIAREREQEKKFANEAILKDLLPVLDNLERALEHAGESTVEQLVSGVGMVLKQFLEVLGRFGVEQFSALHEPFDPEFHEAMQQVESDEHPPGTVVNEFMKGYQLHGRLVRPSMVVVAKAATASAPARAPDGSEADAETPAEPPVAADEGGDS